MPKQRLQVLGAGALMMQVVDYERRTKDGDVLDTVTIPEDVKTRLLELAGRDSDLHTRRRMYIEFVPNGLPFLRQHAVWTPMVELNATLNQFEILALGVVDIVVSKLARFNANDASDIDAMIQRRLVSHQELVAVFYDAMDFVPDQSHKFRDYVHHLHIVERDLFGVAETEIELPSWA